MKNVEQLHREVAVAIVGAGAAGLAAAHVLARANIPYLLIDGRARLGGRAFTEIVNKLPLDLGCGWLHSANKNPWAAIAYKLSFHIDKTKPPWEEQSCDQGMSPAEQEEFQQAFADFETRVDKADLREDRAAAALLDPASRWNPLIDAICTYLNGAGLKEVSAADYRNYQDTDINWRIKEGYGALIGAYGASLPVALRTRVLCINHDGRTLKLVTDRGDIHAQQVIVTVPATALAGEMLRFAPELPDKIEAAHRLPLGLVNKLFLSCDRPAMFPSDGHFFGDWHTAATGSYHLKPFGHPVIEVFVAGALARDLAADGAKAHGAFAAGELVKLLGSDVRKHLRPLTQSAWHDDPFVRGSYSHAEVGCAGARETLAHAVDDRLFFAGEACSVRAFATAHGAFQTGVEAARALIAARAPSRAFHPKFFGARGDI
ncbi:MAG: FAD-dependent oxidoreductase [Rhodospirillaceae bacterium]|nr:FAD-dependent oxidoreductase [Rhodospirillaceae bacterium]